MPENQTAWNSNNQGVKETFTQTSRRGRDGRWGLSREDVQQGSRPQGWDRAGWMGNWRLKASCKILWGLPREEKLPVSKESSLESRARVEQASGMVPSLNPPHKAAKRVALSRWIPKAPPPSNLSAASRQRNMAQISETTEHSHRTKQLGDRQPIWWRI